MPRSVGRLPTGVLICVVGAVLVFAIAIQAGARVAVPAAIAAACALALALQRRSDTQARFAAARAFDRLLLTLPGALVVFFAFNAGGYFPDIVAVAALALVVVVVLRLTIAEEPLAGFGSPLALGAVALGLFAVWALASASWSESTARALIEYDRALVYLLILVLAGSVARTAAGLRWLAGSLAAGALVVASAALATRLAPDKFSTSIPAIGESNLAYPLTYSNALGIVCTFGALLAFYFASSTRLPRLARSLASASLPLFATTVYLTLSRGPVAAAIIGFAAFFLLGRPRGLLTALAATVPTSVIAVAVAYNHPVLTSTKPQTVEAASQGHTVALVVILCAVAAAVIRLVLSPVDDRLREYRLPPERRRTVIGGAWAAGVLIVLVAAVALNAPSRISDQYERFISTGQASPGPIDERQSIFSSANRGIVDNWRVALDGFEDEPLHGQGAGSYETWWYANRPARQASYNVTDAHSLYAEVLGELGIVGFALLAVLIVAVLVALVPFRRGPNRPLYAVLFATALAWVAHAGVDWDWEMPAVTVTFIALGGAALAAHQRTARPGGATQGMRVIVSIFALAAAVAPALVLTSQRQLNDARDALRAGNCARAIDRASASIETLNTRSEPYDVLAICQQRLGYTGFAIAAEREAVERDPNNWRYHFQLGVLLGGASQNTRPSLLRAKRLNPHEPTITRALAEAPEGQAVNWDVELLGPEGALAGERP